MHRICVVDFDETLLAVDSTKYLIFGERLYLKPFILFWGLLLLLVRMVLPRSWQYPVRQRAKYLTLKALNALGEANIVEKYSKIFSSLLNLELLKILKEQYEQVFVISSAWQPIIIATLTHLGAGDFKVIATEYQEDFAMFSTCWYEKKASAARELGLSGFDLYTDSYDDEPLMKLAGKVTLV